MHCASKLPIECIISMIKHILSVPSRKMTTPKFTFKMTTKAVEKNWKVLENYNLDLEKALSDQQTSQLGYGSEFRHPELLDLILHCHPL